MLCRAPPVHLAAQRFVGGGILLLARGGLHDFGEFLVNPAPPDPVGEIGVVVPRRPAAELYRRLGDHPIKCLAALTGRLGEAADEVVSGAGRRQPLRPGGGLAAKLIGVIAQLGDREGAVGRGRKERDDALLDPSRAAAHG